MFVRITQRIPAPNSIASDNSDPSQHCKVSPRYEPLAECAWKEAQGGIQTINSDQFPEAKQNSSELLGFVAGLPVGEAVIGKERR
jgi:hypothetical protein